MIAFAWMIVAALLVAFVWTAYGALRAMKPWRFQFNEHELLIVCPWGYFWLADAGYDVMDHAIWSGLKIGRRIPGSVPGPPKYQRLFEDIYAHERYRKYI